VVVESGYIKSAEEGPPGSISWDLIDWYRVIGRSSIDPFAATSKLKGS